MIDSRELRLGNFVWIHGAVDDVAQLVRNTHSGYQEVNNYPYGEKFNVLHPIPLDEHWLLSFGFTKANEQYFDFYSPSRGKHRMGIKDFKWMPNNHMTIDLKYVHQLQNLFFAVYGEELELKS